MKTFVIGVPRERKAKEGRVGMTPDGVRQVLGDGGCVKVCIECGAGLLAGFSDQAYIDAGAVLVGDTVDLYKSADMIVKVKEPTPEEYPLLEHLRHKTLFTYLHLAGVDPMLTHLLLQYEVSALAYENVEEIIGGRHIFPLLVPMSQIAGTQGMRQGILYAHEHTSPTPHVVIFGGGVVGEAALREAIHQGVASVTLFEMNKERLEELRGRYRSIHKSQYVQVSLMTMEAMKGNRGGKILGRADVVMSAVMNPGGAEAPKVLTAGHFAQMKPGAYIVDVAIDQGGSTEWSQSTKPGETYVREGLIFSCVANIPGSTVPHEATVALTAVTLPYIRLFARYAQCPVYKGEWKLLHDHRNLRQGLQTWRGHLVNSFVASKHNMRDFYEPPDYFSLQGVLAGFLFVRKKYRPRRAVEECMFKNLLRRVFEQVCRDVFDSLGLYVNLSRGKWETSPCVLVELLHRHPHPLVR